MIQIDVYYSSSDKIARLEISGHADYADFGEDIVCAGVSALAETAILSVKSLGIKARIIKKDGYLLLEIPNVKNKTNKVLNDVNTILKAIVLGLEDLSLSYPRHVVLNKREVL